MNFGIMSLMDLYFIRNNQGEINEEIYFNAGTVDIHS